MILSHEVTSRNDAQNKQVLRKLTQIKVYGYSKWNRNKATFFSRHCLRNRLNSDTGVFCSIDVV